MKFSKFGKNKKCSQQKIYKINKRGGGGPNKSGGGEVEFFFKKDEAEGNVYSGPKSRLILQRARDMIRTCGPKYVSHCYAF